MGFHVDILSASPTYQTSISGNAVEIILFPGESSYFMIVLDACYWGEGDAIVDYINVYDEDTGEELFVDWEDLYTALNSADLQD